MVFLWLSGLAVFWIWYNATHEKDLDSFWRRGWWGCAHAVPVRWLGGAIYNNVEWERSPKYERLGCPGVETGLKRIWSQDTGLQQKNNLSSKESSHHHMFGCNFRNPLSPLAHG